MQMQIYEEKMLGAKHCSAHDYRVPVHINRVAITCPAFFTTLMQLLVELKRAAAAASIISTAENFIVAANSNKIKACWRRELLLFCSSAGKYFQLLRDAFSRFTANLRR